MTAPDLNLRHKRKRSRRVGRTVGCAGAIFGLEHAISEDFEVVLVA